MLKKISRFLNLTFNEKINVFIYMINILKTQVIYKNIFKKLGKKTNILKPLKLTNTEYISIGKKVLIWPNARIEAINKYNDKMFNPNIIIEDSVSIQQNIHLTCGEYIHIGEGTAIAANVTITDINHNYEDINIFIEQQDISTKKVVIKSGCKIYNNVVILPGTNIGKHCVIGANSIVSGVIPDYSVAVGSPAKIIKRYNFEKGYWQKTDSEGNFIEE